MRILCTGASGFIGSHLVKALRAKNHTVIEMMRYVSGGRYDSYDKENRVFADLRDGSEVRAAIVKSKPEIICNLAAQSAVAYSFDHPQEVNDVDYLGVIRVAEAAREVDAWLIQASTSEVYGRGGYKYPVNEDVQLGGTSPYAAAKIASEHYLQIMRDTYNMHITVMRPHNTIGRAPLRNRYFVVERAITQAIETGEISLHDPRPIRDFLFRDDHVRGYLRVIEAGEKAYGQTYNLCTGEAWTIEKMAYHVADYIYRQGYRKSVAVSFERSPDRPLDIPVLHGTNAKAQSQIGWIPQYTIAQGLEKACDEWYQVLKS